MFTVLKGSSLSPFRNSNPAPLSYKILKLKKSSYNSQEDFWGIIKYHLESILIQPYTWMLEYFCKNISGMLLPKPRPALALGLLRGTLIWSPDHSLTSCEFVSYSINLTVQRLKIFKRQYYPAKVAWATHHLWYYIFSVDAQFF